jgi:hypothetical protein
MTDEPTTSSASADPPVATADVQDPLPEATWGWRRAFVFAMVTVLCVQLYLLSEKIDDHDDAYWWTLLLLWFVVLCYLVAPSAEQITRMIQSARIIRSGGTIEKEVSSQTAQGSATARSSVSGSPSTQTAPAGSGGAPAGSQGARPPAKPDDAEEDPTWPKA